MRSIVAGLVLGTALLSLGATAAEAADRAPPDRAAAVAAGPTIVFASVREGRRSIWRSGPGAAQLHRITSPPRATTRCACRFGEYDSHPAWSADGRHVAFTRGARVFIANPNGSGLRRIPAPAGSEDFEPAWSSRGRLAFMRQRPSRRGQGYVYEIVSVDGRGADTRIIAPASRSAYRSFAWSHDGRRLAYAVPYFDPAFVIGLFVKRTPSGAPRFLLRAVGIGELSWSPDDRSLAFASSVPGAEPFDPYRLFAIRLQDRRILQLTRNRLSRAGDGAPRWSPDGRLVAFTRSDSGRDAVYVVRPNGSGERLLVRDSRGGAWSPDGRRLAVIEGVSGKSPLTLSVIALRSASRVTLSRLRHPADADFLGAQSWRPPARR